VNRRRRVAFFQNSDHSNILAGATGMR
jgi:hypothetical protein